MRDTNQERQLNDRKVISLRKQFSQGATQACLANQFGVSQSCVSKITRGYRWRHLGISAIPSDSHRARGERCHSSKLTQKGVVLMRALSKLGESNAELARLFAVSPVLVGLIVRRKIWKWV